jgi:hypothetical protein
MDEFEKLEAEMAALQELADSIEVAELDDFSFLVGFASSAGAAQVVTYGKGEK